MAERIQEETDIQPARDGKITVTDLPEMAGPADRGGLIEHSIAYVPDGGGENREQDQKPIRLPGLPEAQPRYEVGQGQGQTVFLPQGSSKKKQAGNQVIRPGQPPPLDRKIPESKGQPDQDIEVLPQGLEDVTEKDEGIESQTDGPGQSPPSADKFLQQEKKTNQGGQSDQGGNGLSRHHVQGEEDGRREEKKRIERVSGTFRRPVRPRDIDKTSAPGQGPGEGDIDRTVKFQEEIVVETDQADG